MAASEDLDLFAARSVDDTVIKRLALQRIEQLPVRTLFQTRLTGSGHGKYRRGQYQMHTLDLAAIQTLQHQVIISISLALEASRVTAQHPAGSDCGVDSARGGYAWTACRPQ